MIQSPRPKKLKWPVKFIYYMIPFQLTWMFLSVLYPDTGGFFPIMRASIVICLVVVPLLRRFKYNPVNTSVILFIIYVILLFPFVSDLPYSFRTSLRMFLSLLMLPVGYTFVTSLSIFSSLNKKIIISYVIIILGLLLSNILGVRYSDFITYSKDLDIETGGLSDGWNNVTYLLLLAPLYFFQIKGLFKKRVFFILSFILLIFVILSFKRIAVLGVVFGFLIFSKYYGSIGQSFKKVSIVILLLGLTFPFVAEIINMQYEARSDRFDKNAIQSENRFYETGIIWEQVFSFRDPVRSIFGLEAFNSIGKYGGGSFGDRTLHVDYNFIILTTGIVGLFLYLNIYFQLFKEFRRNSTNSQIKYYKLLKATFLSIFFTSLLTSVAGQMGHISFRSIIFLYLGAILGAMKSFKQELEIDSVSKVSSVKQYKN